jgi:PemK-like, MazF-like toxin of type II toxin-antitoxin system
MREFLRRLFGRHESPPPAHTQSRRPGSGRDRSVAEADAMPAYGGARDHVGGARIVYQPERDGDPDPGEVVWCWVAYEDDPNKGKDRPVIAMGHIEYFPDLLVVQLSSQSRHAEDPDWLSVGTGDWDPQQRESFADLDRPLAVSPGAVRREGGTLAKQRFDEVAEELRRRYGYT